MFGLEQLPAVVKDLPSPEGKWELLELIGEGNYGEVYRARNIINGDVAAIKVMEAVLDKEEDIKAELNVFENHSHHPNIVDFYGAFVRSNKLADDQLWIAMEYCSSGSVTDLAKAMKEKGDKISEDIIAYILREVLAGLCYLHCSCVLHRDVKGQNILLTNTARVKLIDFGISAITDSPTGRRRTAIGTPYWMAPEVIACENQLDCDYDSRSDIWSLGITAIEVADSTPPLFGEHPVRALFKIPKHSPPTLQTPSEWSTMFNDFVHLCLIKDFEKRPNSKQLLTHNFVSHIPSDPRSIRRKLVTLLNIQEETTPLTDSSASTSVDTARKNVLALKTLDTVSDLAGLEYINENIIVSQLWKRYQKQLIYTYVGDILVSINPFQKLDIYGEKYSLLYCNAPRSHLPPHIFATANSTYQQMVHEKCDQCCVVSGESGAGKTEASNILVQQFMKLGKAKTRSLEEKILKINPLMESFGNARTIINNNSSRFGKYLELHFTLDGHVVGAHVSEYLLEKSRVISQARREKNFHIFYYLLAGLGARKQLERFRLKSGHHHRYLEHRGTHKGNSRQDSIYSERFDEIEQAFYLFDFTKAEFDCIQSILAAILNIGDIRLAEEIHPHVGEVCTISNINRVNDVASLLQVRAESLHRVITTSKVIAYGETIVKQNTPEKAMDARDAIAKALYGRLFSWIVNRINPALTSHASSSSELHIGILDIFGFENFRKNSFEQLCINVTNEQLQFYFNQHVFAWEQEEYEREGINVAEVGYTDNRPLLELFLSRPMGLLSLLDEESKFPRSSDHSLATKFHGNFKSSLYYQRPKDGGPTFTITHYAGNVTYETATFLEKNRDTLKPDVMKMLQKSSNSVVRLMFFTPLSRTGSLSAGTAGKMILHKPPLSATPLFNRRAPHNKSRLVRRPHPTAHGHTPLSSSDTLTAKLSQTVSTYFINSLRELMSRMLLAQPHFVRCICPNEMKRPDMFQPDKVLLQLRYTGVLETVRIRKEGFPHRISFDDFIQRYRVVYFPLSVSVPGTVSNCAHILREIGLENWAIGKTKVFLKYYHLEHLIKVLSGYERSATVLQSVMRGWMARKKVKKMKEERQERAAVVIQAGVRRFLIRNWYLKFLSLRRERAALIIQTAFKSWLHNSQYLKYLHDRQVVAIKIQSVFRRWRCLMKYQAQRKAVLRIQRAVRCWLARKHLKKLLEEKARKKEEERVKNKIKKQRESLRLKLQRHAQSSIQQMTEQNHVIEPNQEISGTVIQLAYPKSIASCNRAVRAGHDDTDYFNPPGERSSSELTQERTACYNLKEERKDFSPRHYFSHGVTSNNKILSPEERFPHSEEWLSLNAPSHFPRKLWTVEQHVPQKSQVYAQQHNEKSVEPDVIFSHEGNNGDNDSDRKENYSHAETSSNTILSVKRVFEDLISHHTAEVTRDNPLLWRQKGNVLGHQRIKVKRPKNKPDSVIQKLLEKFDPLKLNSLRPPHVS